MTDARPRGRPPKIRFDDIVETGVRLGLEDLTVVAVADELGVRDSSIYRYVPTREELLHAVAERILEQFDPVFDASPTVHDMLVQFGLRVRAFLDHHPGMARYCTEHGERPPIRRLAERIYDDLVGRGFGAAGAVVAIDAVSTLVFANAQTAPIGIQGAPEPVDFDALSTNHAAGRRVTDAIDPNRYFEWLLDITVTGLLEALDAGEFPW